MASHDDEVSNDADATLDDGGDDGQSDGDDESDEYGELELFTNVNVPDEIKLWVAQQLCFILLSPSRLMGRNPECQTHNRLPPNPEKHPPATIPANMIHPNSSLSFIKIKPCTHPSTPWPP